MPLDKQKVQLPFGQGINTKNDPKQLPPGKLTVLHNGVFSTGNEIRKRNGYSALSQNIQGSGTIAHGCLVQSYNNELLELDGQSLYSYNSSGTNWVNKGALVTTSLSSSSVIRNTTNLVMQDSAINANLRCFAWSENFVAIKYSIFDTSTGQAIVKDQTVLSSGGVAPKVLALGTKFVILYSDSANLKYKSIDISTPTTISAAVTIATDLNSQFLFDASVFNSRIYISYASSSTHVSLYYLDSSLVLSSKLNAGTESANAAITIFGDVSNRPWVGYANGTNFNGFVAASDLSGTVSAPVLINSSVAVKHITGIVSGTTGTFYYEVAGSGTVSGVQANNFIKTNTLAVSGTVGTAGSASVFNRDVGLGSKAFVYNSVNYFMATKSSTLQSTYFLFNGSGAVVAKITPDSGGGYVGQSLTLTEAFCPLPEVNLVSSGVFQFSSLIKDLLVVVGGAQSTQTGVQAVQISFTANSIPNIVLGQNSMIGGGIINMYDGANVVEHGYNVFPEGLSATASTAAFANGTVGHVLSGSVFGVGTTSFVGSASIQYCATYEWTDNQGQVHRSAPSIPVTLSASSFGVVSHLTGTMAGSTSTITGISDATGVAAGQYVTFLSPTFVANPKANALVSTVSTNSITISNAHSGTGTINGQPFIVTGKPIGWITSVLSATAGSNQLTANGANYDNLSIGQVLISSGTGDNGKSESDIFPEGTYITAISQDGGTTGGQVTITISNPLSYATSAGSFFYSTDVMTVSIVVPTLRITSKSGVTIPIYKTEQNGTIFYLTTSPTSPPANDKTVDSITITDSTLDSVLIGNSQLYTTGGELENIEAPASSALQTFKSRAISLPPESTLSWWYSKQVIPGSPVEFSDQFVNNIDSRIGHISAVGVLDEKIIFFGPNSKYFVVGDGPAPSGANNDFSPAQHITGATGCTNQNSILEIPVGLIYQDPTKGIYLLDRSLSESYIGQDVEQYNLDPITSAQLIPDTTSLRLTLTSGTVLVYDWFYNQWGNDPYVAEAVSSTLYSNAFTYCQANGVVLSETSGTYTDNGAFFSLAPTTGWISFAGVQGFQRVYELHILGDYKSPHTLTINIYKDFDDSTVKQTITIPVTSDPSPYEFRIRMNDQVSKCSALKISISDSSQSGSGESYSLSNIAFVVGVKQGLNKLPAAKSY